MLGTASALTVIFCTVAAPLGFLQSSSGDYCLTFWGFKANCRSVGYTQSIQDLGFGCDDLRAKLRALGPLCVAAIGLAFVTLDCVAVGITYRVDKMKLPLIATAYLTLGCLTACWALMTTIETREVCSGLVMRDAGWAYSDAFALVVTSFCLMLCGSVFITIMKVEFLEHGDGASKL